MQPRQVISPPRCTNSAGDSNEGNEEGVRIEGSEIENVDEEIIDESDGPQLLAPVQSQNMDETAEGETDEPEIYGTPEARVPPTLPDPQLPSPQEIAEHNRTHCPTRSWCPICTAAAGRESRG